MSFLDVLKSHSDTCCIMLYGSVTDCILSRDLCFREFSVALHDILCECGYQNVVFYDFTRASGKYVYDDLSACYSIAGAAEPYRQKYGSSPAVPSAPAQSVKAGTGGRRFGQQRKVVGTAASPAQNDSQTSAQNDIRIPHQQRNLDPALFYGEVSARMTDSNIRTAFVFDLAAFLRDSCSLQNIHNILYQWHNTKNIIIFVNSDSRSVNDDDTMIHLLKSSGMYQFFCTENDKRSPIYRPDRCFPILSVQRDEVLYLLQRLRVLRDAVIADGIDEAADKINYILHANSRADTLSMRKLAELCGKILDEQGTSAIDEKFYEALASVCGMSLKDCDFHPLRKLHNRPGWGSAVEKLIAELLRVCQATSGDTCTAKTIDEKILWLTERNKNRQYDSEETLAVFRLGSSNVDKSYPDSSKLPHIMLIGRPGTGKTTAAIELGRIFHDAGLLESGHVVQADAGSLQGGHVGQTPMRVNEWLDKSENGVLFIDEAYILCKNFGKEGNAGTFAQEAVDTLVNAMTDKSRHVLVIFAGYPSDNPADPEDISSVRGLYKMNPGLSRRTTLELEIEDYEPETLTDIFMHSLEHSGLPLGDDLSRDNIINFMKYHYQTRTNDFANGDFAVKTAEKCTALARNRQSTTINAEDFGEGKKYLEVITMDSIQAELQEYPGLSDVGMRIIQDSVNLFKNRQAVGIKAPPSPKHVILAGKRGTGKNTLANILCKAWGIAGLMSGKPPVVITNPASCNHDTLERDILRAIHDHTPLFIDEAHNASGGFVSELLNPMTEYENLTCIFAVYPERLESFFRKDPGLRDRCMKPYEIPDYTPDQLTEIFMSIAGRQHREADASCIEALRVWFGMKYSVRDSDSNYSNARMVENVVERMEAVTDKRMFTESDIPPEILKDISIQKPFHGQTPGGKDNSDVLDQRLGML